DRLLSYRSDKISVHYNRLLCSKAAECGKRLPAVFNNQCDPWIEPTHGTVDEIIEVVKACPSGALSYQLPSQNIRHEVNEDSSIILEESGPYHVTNAELRDTNWNAGASRKKYSLCRCGASKNKPFCDGSHKTD
ncbi:MAG: (4Fe-4S)-binding protein, partial [Kangiellaceae bacterium]|nr:(4Fe-4S)-binding protein [Kangiellaceae bacterium]